MIHKDTGNKRFYQCAGALANTDPLVYYYSNSIQVLFRFQVVYVFPLLTLRLTCLSVLCDTMLLYD